MSAPLAAMAKGVNARGYSCRFERRQPQDIIEVAIVSAADSNVLVRVMPANEHPMIARHATRLLRAPGQSGTKDHGA